jgi:uncharacterized nucleotidyltransferase DUF6036
MRREDFDHVIAAAAEVSGEPEIVVIGSQAILGSAPCPPKAMLFSMEADVYPLRDPAKAAEIDGSLGDGSFFHATYGYYAHGVGPETAKAPAGWQNRLVSVEIPPRVAQQAGVVALCLEAHDLVLAKCVGGRERDWEFASAAIDADLVQVEELLRRVADLPEPPADRAHIRAMIEGRLSTR